MKKLAQRKHSSDWSKELSDLISGASGGFLFGIPLLYTMEVWFVGSQVSPPLLLAILSLTYVIVFLLDRIEGFRKHKSKRVINSAMESVEALAIGIVCATFTLIILQRITGETSLTEALGKIIFESVPCSFGVALSRSILSGERNQSSESKPSGAKPTPQKKQNRGLLKDTRTDLSATLIGATIIAFNIAPTDEVPMLAAAASPPWLLTTIAASLVVSYGIVFAAGFTDQRKRRQQQGLFQSPIGETIFSYIMSLVAAMLMLVFFQQLSFDDPWDLWLRYTLILGLPATIGGAAGRLAV